MVPIYIYTYYITWCYGIEYEGGGGQRSGRDLPPEVLDYGVYLSSSFSPSYPYSSSPYFFSFPEQ